MSLTRDRVLAYLSSRAGRPLRLKELAQGLRLSRAQVVQLKALLAELEDAGVVYRVRQQRYAIPARINLVTGRLQTTRAGNGFVAPESGDQDLYVPAANLASAVDGDRVVARVERKGRRSRPEGRIIRVLERAHETVVGVFHAARGFAYVTPLHRRLGMDLFVPPGCDGGAHEGDVVVVWVTTWGESHRGPAGQVERLLGPLGAPGVDMLTIIHTHGLPSSFPPEVEDAARQAAAHGIQETDRAGRRDLRSLMVFTIDPPDAQDHDDALSVEATAGGQYRIGIHIADVAHYVPPGSPLDLEAMRRGTSVYLVDRTIPMLPAPLSAGLCSLRPDEDRLALSLILVLDAQARVHRQTLIRSVIRSRYRLTYDQVQAVLDGDATIDPAIDTALCQLRDLSRQLRQRRQQRGSLDFDLPEARVVLNSSGEPTDIQRVLRLESHRLVEDFMVLANETVARRAVRRRLPFIYRVHEAPDADGLEGLRTWARTLGFPLRQRGSPTPRDLQQLLESARGSPAENLLAALVLRAMKQARYSTVAAGHFGLATRHYTHFTSPIRRYPDLMIHRLCARVFVDRAAPLEAATPAQLEAVSRLASERERLALAAERDSVDLKKVEFMERHLGDDFAGTISNVTAYGFFVLLDAFYVEGLVHVSTLTDDFYHFDEERFLLGGERRGRRFCLGDRVQVQVSRVEREQRQIDFVLLTAPPTNRGGRPRRGTRR